MTRQNPHLTHGMKVCLAAALRGPLVRDAHAWRFGRRAFSRRTVFALRALRLVEIQGGTARATPRALPR